MPKESTMNISKGHIAEIGNNILKSGDCADPEVNCYANIDESEQHAEAMGMGTHKRSRMAPLSRNEIDEKFEVLYRIPPLPVKHASVIKNLSQFKLLCRLIATHQKNPEPHSSVKFMVDGQMSEFRVLHNINIGQNIKCLVFKKDKEIVNAISGQIIMSEIVFAFNWFSPVGVWDYISLGLDLMMNSSGIESDFLMCSEAAMRHAKAFYHHSEIRQLLQEIKLGFISEEDLAKECFPASTKCTSTKEKLDDAMPDASKVHPILLHVHEITITGFSMGGSTAHAFAVLLKEERKMPQRIRCVGFGSPRPGNHKLNEWVSTNLTPDSLNIVLASEELMNELHVDENEVEAKDSHSSTEGRSHIKSPNLMMSNHYLKCQKQNQQCHVKDSWLDIKNPKILIYDPVTTSPSFNKGFDIHPKLYTLILQKGGLLFPMAEEEKDRLRHYDKMERSDFLGLDTICHLAMRAYDSKKSKSFDQLHSVLKYYEALASL